MNSFSLKNRAAFIKQMSSESFDIVVIGGGITGAGIALDAISRGLKVALVEMQDFAAGTSSRSTKLIHGGLRYLKQMEFKLVAEVGQERAIVHSNAPHLTKPEHLLLPIVKNGSLTMFTARLGMTIYEWLAGVKKEERYKSLSKEQTLLAEPLLKTDDLLGGILFYEYRTDDARLTMEIMKEAVSRGALALNYVKAAGFTYSHGKMDGIQAIDLLTQEQFVVKGKYIVNATGPWVDEVDDLDKKQEQHKLHITKGVHIVVDGQKLPLKQSAYFDTDDKRMVFVIPREGKTYIGTTDTFYKGDLANPKITQEDVTYLLKCANDIFPTVHLTESDVESHWVGLRPLIQKPGKGPSEISRKDEIFESQSGLITIAGGKLTGYRKMAQRIVDLVAKKMKTTSNKSVPSCSTKSIALSGGKLGGIAGLTRFTNEKLKQGADLGFTDSEVKLLVNRFGLNTNTIFEIARDIKQKGNNKALPILLEAQLKYCLENEMCITPADFLIRRSGALYFDIGLVKKWYPAVLNYMKAELSFNKELTHHFEMELRESNTSAVLH